MNKFSAEFVSLVTSTIDAGIEAEGSITSAAVAKACECAVETIKALQAEGELGAYGVQCGIKGGFVPLDGLESRRAENAAKAESKAQKEVAKTLAGMEKLVKSGAIPQSALDEARAKLAKTA